MLRVLKKKGIKANFLGFENSCLSSMSNTSSNINEVIRAVLNSFSFLRKDFARTKIHQKAQKAQKALKSTKSTKNHGKHQKPPKTQKAPKSTKTQPSKNTKTQISKQKIKNAIKKHLKRKK